MPSYDGLDERAGAAAALSLRSSWPSPTVRLGTGPALANARASLKALPQSGQLRSELSRITASASHGHLRPTS